MMLVHESFPGRRDDPRAKTREKLNKTPKAEDVKTSRHNEATTSQEKPLEKTEEKREKKKIKGRR